MKRRSIVFLGLGVFFLAAVAYYVMQEVGVRSNVRTVAIYNLVSHPILDASVKGIKAELASRGYTEGRVRFIDVNANGKMESLSAFARELLAAKPDVIVPVSTPVTQAVFKAAGPDQAIVYSTVTNPGDVGMDSRPANMTGVSDAVNYEANLNLITELFPNVKTIGIIYNASERNSQFGMDRVRELVGRRNLQLALVAVSNSGEVADAARSLSGKIDVYYVGSDNTVVSGLDALLSVARERRIPVIASDIGSVEKGALAAVSVDYERVGREAGRIVAQVLDTRARPGTIEKVFVYGESLILNQDAASKIGFQFPDAVKQRAAKVIP